MLELVESFLLTLVGIFNIYPFFIQKFAVKSTCCNGFYYGCLIAAVKPDIEEPLNFDSSLKRFLHNRYLARTKLKCFLTVSRKNNHDSKFLTIPLWREVGLCSELTVHNITVWGLICKNY